ncbi:hypothetical protein HG537_0A05390 [Torulaspora globosa]|uniref:Uncharacterized protein n=1 Tax=Torulaspora globosa TaxID=48254 RepID=A0A7H9HPQ5_9SACH|nr:hypothetical protein HG537_0A05390 [Torulaspora sp. CBS 2947]
MLQNYLLTQLLLLILFLISTAKGLPSPDVILGNPEARVNNVTNSKGASLSDTTGSYNLEGNDLQSTVTMETGSLKNSITPVYLVSSQTDPTPSGNTGLQSREPAGQSFKVSSRQGSGIPEVASSLSSDSITPSSGKTSSVPTAEFSQMTSMSPPSFESKALSASQGGLDSFSISSLITISTEASFASSGFNFLADSTSSLKLTQSAAKMYSSTVTEQLASAASRTSDLFSIGSTEIPARSLTVLSLTEFAGDALSDIGSFQSQILIDELYDLMGSEDETFSSTDQTSASSSFDVSSTSTSTDNTLEVASSISSTSTSISFSSLTSGTTSDQSSSAPDSSSKQSPVIQPPTSTDEEPSLGSFSKKTIDLVASQITSSESSDTSTVQTTRAKEPTTTSITGLTTSSPLQPTEEGNQYRTTDSPSTDAATTDSSTQQTEELTVYPSTTESQISSDGELSTFLITTDLTTKSSNELPTTSSISSTTENAILPVTTDLTTESSNELPATSSISSTTENAILPVTTDVTSQSAEDYTTFLITTESPNTASSASNEPSATTNPSFVFLGDTTSVPSSITMEQTIDIASYLSSPTSNSALITEWPETTNAELTSEATSPIDFASTVEVRSSPVLNTDYPTDFSVATSDNRAESTTVYNPQDLTLLSSTRQTEIPLTSNDGRSSSITMEATTLSSAQPITEVSNHDSSSEALVAFDSQSTEKSNALTTLTFSSSYSFASPVMPDISSLQSMPATDLRTQLQASSLQYTGKSEPISLVQSTIQPTGSSSGIEQVSSYQVSEPQAISSGAITESQSNVPTSISSGFVQESETANSLDSLHTSPKLSATVSTASVQESNYGMTPTDSHTGPESSSESAGSLVGSSQGLEYLTYRTSQMATPTQSLDITANSMGMLTTISTSSAVSTTTGTWWLPSSIEVQSQTSNAGTSSFNPSVTAILPQVIAPQSTVVPAPGSTKITIGFGRELNFEFLAEHPQSSAQIFAFLPSVLVYPFSTNQIKDYNGANDNFTVRCVHNGTTTVAPDSYFVEISTDLKQANEFSFANVSDVEVIEIQPMIIKQRNYLLSVAVVYFPGDLVSELQRYITNTNSTLYHNPNPTFNALAQLIDPSIPLTGLVDGPPGGSSPIPTQDPHSPSQPDASKSSSSDGESGSLETTVNSHITFAITKRLVAYLLCLVFGTLLWIIASLLIHRYLQNLRNRSTNMPNTFQDYEKRHYLSTDVTSFHSAISSASNHNGNLIQSINKDCASDHHLTGDLVVTGDNTVYSVSHNLEYYVDQDGSFYYAGAMDSTTDGNESTKHTSPDMEDIDDFLYSAEQEPASLAINETSYDIGSLEIDDEGNFIVSDPSEEVEPIVLQTDNSETVQSYNNRNLYKMTESTNSYENSSEARQTNDPSDPFEAQNHGSYFTDNNDNVIQYIPDGDSIEEYLYDGPTDAFSASGSPEVQIDEMDDDVIDIHVKDLDELDEEMYRRLSKIMEHQQNNESGNLHISNVIAAKAQRSEMKPRSQRDTQ